LPGPRVRKGAFYMENLYKVLCFGDSSTEGYTSVFEDHLKKQFHEVNAVIVNAGGWGETSGDGLSRLPDILEEDPEVVVIGFGMNDQERGVSLKEFTANISNMVSAFQEAKVRVLMLTINPVRDKAEGSGNVRVEKYNRAIKELAREKHVRIVDINSQWKQQIKPLKKGLRDSCHPNELGNKLYAQTITR